MRDSDWSRPILLRSDWLGLIGAIMTTISVCELSPMKILSPVRLMEKTQSSAKRERRAWNAGRGGEKKHCAGEK